VVVTTWHNVTLCPPMPIHRTVHPCSQKDMVKSLKFHMMGPKVRNH
jgi:hypothetical protein